MSVGCVRIRGRCTFLCDSLKSVCGCRPLTLYKEQRTMTEGSRESESSSSTRTKRRAWSVDRLRLAEAPNFPLFPFHHLIVHWRTPTSGISHALPPDPNPSCVGGGWGEGCGVVWVGGGGVGEWVGACLFMWSSDASCFGRMQETRQRQQQAVGGRVRRGPISGDRLHIQPTWLPNTAVC